jgi:hypothetical protein
MQKENLNFHYLELFIINITMIPQYEWIKKGSDWVRIQIPVNKWKGIPPIEDEIKKPLISQRLIQT